MLMAYWNDSGFKALKKQWNEKLKLSGFKDAEDENGNLIQKDHRTNAFRSKDATEEFYESLSRYLNTNKDITPRDRQILELYSEGFYISGKNSIMKQTGHCRRLIHYVIARHKKLIIF